MNTSNNISRKPKFVPYFVAICATVCFLLSVGSSMWPRHWHYTKLERLSSDNSRSVPFAFFCHEPNILIINGVACKREPSKPYEIAGGAGMLQISGLGFMGSNLEQTPGAIVGFSHAYHYLTTPPRIYFSHDSTFKVFHISRSMWRRNVEIHVDDKVFHLSNRRVPLVLLIEEDTRVTKIENFEQTFGCSLASFLQRPYVLTLLPECSRDSGY